MQIKQSDLEIVGNFLEEYYHYTLDYIEAAANAVEDLKADPAYRNLLKQAFQGVIKETLPPNVLFELVRNKGGLLVTGDNDAKSFLRNLYTELILSEEVNASNEQTSDTPLNTSDTFDTLLANLNSSNRQFSYSAIAELGRSGDANAVEPLIKKLKESDEAFQIAIVQALGWLADKKATEPILAILDSSEDVKSMAMIALGSLCDVQAVKPLAHRLINKNGTMNYNASQALQQLGSLAVPTLLDLIRQGNEQAKITLQFIRDHQAVEMLIQALDDPEPSVRMSAAASLGQIDDPKAIEPLIKLLSDSNESVCVSAMGALGNLKAKAAVESIANLSRDSNDYKRNVALSTLKEIA